MYESRYWDRDWVPHDEGTLAQSAVRVLQGQIPHRDFDEVYTGGLSYLHAVALKLFGLELTSLRFVLFAFFVAWVPAFFYVASRFTSARIASLATLVAVAWSVPNYSASLPSWYTLFFATFASAAVLRYIERPQSGWLFVAGLAAGASTVVKITGVYEIAAVATFLVLRNQFDRCGVEGRAPRRDLVDRGAVIVFAALLVLFVFSVVRTDATAGGVADFVVPALSIAGFMIWNELRLEGRSSFVALGRMIGAFAAGVMVPTGVFLTMYVVTGSVGALLHGVFVAPASRIANASYDPPGLIILLALLPFVLSVALARAGSRRDRRIGVALAMLPPAAVFSMVGPTGLSALVWSAVRGGSRLLLPLAILLLARALRRGHVERLSAERALVVLSATSLGVLVQFPFSAPVYFLYVVPLVLLVALACAPLAGPQTGSSWSLVAGLALMGAAAAWWLAVGYSPVTGRSHYERLNLAPAGIEVSHRDRIEYERVVQLVQKHIRNGNFVYAGPDAPEISFLSGYENPTRAMFDFLAPEGRLNERQLLRRLRSADVQVAVINRRPVFSRPLSVELRRSLAHLYPHRSTAGRFEVRWRSR